MLVTRVFPSCRYLNIPTIAFLCPSFLLPKTNGTPFLWCCRLAFPITTSYHVALSPLCWFETIPCPRLLFCLGCLFTKNSQVLVVLFPNPYDHKAKNTLGILITISVLLISFFLLLDGSNLNKVSELLKTLFPSLLVRIPQYSSSLFQTVSTQQPTRILDGIPCEQVIKFVPVVVPCIGAYS